MFDVRKVLDGALLGLRHLADFFIERHAGQEFLGLWIVGRKQLRSLGRLHRAGQVETGYGNDAKKRPAPDSSRIYHAWPFTSRHVISPAVSLHGTARQSPQPPPRLRAGIFPESA